MHDPRTAGDWRGGYFELLSEEPDRRIYRRHPSAKTMSSPILVVEAVGGAGRKPDHARLRHEDGLKERLDD